MRHGHSMKVAHLLQRRLLACPDLRCSAECACMQTGDVSLIEYLLQNGAKFDKADPYGRTPLHYCILHEHPQAAKQLLKR